MDPCDWEGVRIGYHAVCRALPEVCHPGCRELLQPVTGETAGFWIGAGLFGLTNVLEYGIYRFWLAVDDRSRLPGWLGRVPGDSSAHPREVRWWLLVLILNLSTHPLVTFGIPPLVREMRGDFFDYVVIAESFALLTEAGILVHGFGFSPRKAIGASAAANLFSWIAGGWFLRAFF